MIALSGEQITLVHGDLSAVITEVGATLRCFRIGPEPVVWEFSESEIDSGARGQVLAPWPNRLEDGSYQFGDRNGNAALDEPDRSNAIHGMVRWMAWKLEDRSENIATLSCVIHPQPGYPFRVRLELDYELGESGLKVTWRATNTGDNQAPFGIGFHPYVAGGPEGIDSARVELPASRRLLLDDRGLPIGHESVRGTKFDLEGATLSGLVLDDCYTDLAVGPDGCWRCRIEQDKGTTVLWAEAVFGYVMCYTPGSTPDSLERRPAIAIEPMTCPPNAFRTGIGVIELEPDEQRQASWGISVSG